MLTGRVYVMLDIYKLQNQYSSLKTRTRALRSSRVEEAEGYELTEKADSTSAVSAQNEKVMAIKKEWRGWKLASIKNTYVPVFSLCPSLPLSPPFPPSLLFFGLLKPTSLSPSRTKHGRIPLMTSGYGPLTLHWGAGPMWTSPLITSVLGCVAATAKLAEEWDRQG